MPEFMPWVFLLLAGFCEMVWPLGFKYTNGFSKNYWAVGGTFAVMVLSLYLMSLATKGQHGVHVGTAYAVWTGLGAAGTAALGMWLFHEPRDVMRIVCLGMIISGAVGLKFLSPPQQPAQSATGVSKEPG
jgi:quaternary ammonium compound-resistance protein SugE